MEFMKRFKIRLQGGGDGHCAPRKEESSGRLVKSISSVIKQRVPVKCVEDLFRSRDINLNFSLTSS